MNCLLLYYCEVLTIYCFIKHDFYLWIYLICLGSIMLRYLTLMLFYRCSLVLWIEYEAIPLYYAQKYIVKSVGDRINFKLVQKLSALISTKCRDKSFSCVFHCFLHSYYISLYGCYWLLGSLECLLYVYTRFIVYNSWFIYKLQ